jgi:hypothetical protein
MSGSPQHEDESGDQRPPDSRRAAIKGMIVTLVLILVGLALVHILRKEAALQDCIMSGQTNCAPIDGTTR